MTPPLYDLRQHGAAIRRIVYENRGLNPRVFGSVLHRENSAESDLDLLIDAAEGMSLFDMAAMAIAIEALIHTKVDIRTPGDLAIKFRNRIVAEAVPV